MEKEQIIDSERDRSQSSSNSIEPNEVKSSHHNSLTDPREQRHNTPPFFQHDSKLHPETQALKGEKQHFIRELLRNFGYQKTMKCFEKECRSAERDKNPEEASNKKKIPKQKKRDFGENYFKQIIQSSQSFEAMLKAFQSMYDTDYEINYEQVAANMQQIALKMDFERKLRSLFSSKKQAVIPKYKSIEILMQQGREVKFIDVNIHEKICLLDSEDNIYIITNKGVSKPFKVDDGNDIVYLKWINSTTIFSISMHGKVTVYSHQGNEVKLKETIPLKMPKIKRINLHILKYPEQPEKQYVRILLKNENAQFIACQIVVHKNELKFTGGTLFETNHSFKSFNIIKVPKDQLEPDEMGSQELTEIEHYYGLADNSRCIIKFDTIVKKQGIIWTSSKKIDSMVNSKCRFFLILLLVDSKDRRRRMHDENQSRQTRTETIFQYEFVKMNGHGCIIEKISLDLQSPLLPGGLCSVGLSRMRLMDPDWLVCFDWQDSIVYASIKSGKILHVQELEEDVKVIGVGPSNCLVCSGQDKIFILSIKQGEKRRVLLQRRQQIRDRESLILRLTRNGIPETLLQLLQELRNNQVEIIES